MTKSQATLIIVESPTKAKTLSRFLGGDYDVEATMGHIMDLPKSKLGVDVKNDFKPEYETILKKEETIKSIQTKSKKAERIYLATDPDREGEAIAAHVAEILAAPKAPNPSNSSNPPFRRIVFHEITKEAVEEAIANPRDLDKNLVDAQIGRRVLDRLVGYELSPLLWRKVRRGLSAGRVQSVAVRLIVEREREIQAFKPEEYWEIYVTTRQLDRKTAGQLILQLVKIGEKKAEVKNGDAAKLVVSELEAAKYKVSDVKKREVVKNPYPPFTTSTMTQAGARLFFWSAKRTMRVAQGLYEEGLITYHRTDSVNLAASAVSKVREFIKKEYGEKYLPASPRFYKVKSKVVQEAHEAIRPTTVDRLPTTAVDSSQWSIDGKKLYELIWKRFVACQMTSSVYDETTIDVTARQPDSQTARRQTVILPSRQAEYLLRASGQVMKFDGWRKVVPLMTHRPQTTAVDSSQLAVDEVILPEVTKDDPLKLIKVDPFQKFTEPPARFNEASLIKTLESLGIGRPSTYAPIISTIQIRQYVEKEEGRFVPTPVGFAVNDFLMANFPDVFEYAFTAGMEDNLDNIANGKLSWVKTIKDFWTPFEKKLKTVGKEGKRVKIEVEKLGKTCPLCKKGELVIRIGRFGKFISCSRFPDCKYTEKYIEKIGMTCPECKKGEVIVKTTRRGKKFFGCSRYPDCKFASWRKPEMGVKNENKDEKN